MPPRGFFLTLALCLSLASTALLFHSCDDDDDEGDSLVIATINRMGLSTDFYFTLDNGQTLYPTRIDGGINNTYTDGQRAFIIFSLIDEEVTGYDHNIHLKSVTLIPTRPVIQATGSESPESTWGNSPINVTYMWMSSDCKYLTLEYQYYGNAASSAGESFNLVLPADDDDPSTNPVPSDVLYLEFRHKNEGSASPRLQEGYVSFNLNDIYPLMAGKNTLRISVNTIYNGNKTYDVAYTMPE